MDTTSLIHALKEDVKLTERVDAFKGITIAKNTDSELYAEKLELAEYKFLTLSLVGPFNIKTKDGCKVGLVVDTEPIVVESDTMDILSDFSKKLNLGITQFDIDLDDNIIELVINNRIAKIWIEIADHKLQFIIEDRDVLKEIVLAVTPVEEIEEIPEENKENENLPKPTQNEESI